MDIWPVFQTQSALRAFAPQTQAPPTGFQVSRDENDAQCGASTDVNELDALQYS